MEEVRSGDGPPSVRVRPSSPKGGKLSGRWKQTRVGLTSSVELHYAITYEQGMGRLGDHLGAFVRDGASARR
jgi:hypothetical protein